MSSTHKISALRSLATKVALGLGIALVASSIAPLAVAPASAGSGDYVDYLDTNAIKRLTDNGSLGGAHSSATALPTFASFADMVPSVRAVKYAGGSGDVYYEISGSDVFMFQPHPSNNLNYKIFTGSSSAVPTALAISGGQVYLAVYNPSSQKSVVYVKNAAWGSGPFSDTYISNIGDGGGISTAGAQGILALAFVGTDMWYTFNKDALGGAFQLTLRKVPQGTMPMSWTDGGASAPISLGVSDASVATGNHQILVDGTDLYIPKGSTTTSGLTGSMPGLKKVATTTNTVTSVNYSNVLSSVSYVSLLDGGLYASGLDGSNTPTVVRVGSNGSAAWSSTLPDVTAIWAKQGPRVNIYYDANNGSGTMAYTVAVPNTSITLPANTFTRNGFTFMGWGTNNTASTAAYADQASYTVPASGSVNLYALWAYTVTYNANGATSGSAPSAALVSANSNTLLNSSPGLSKNGDAFVGWDTNASSTCPARRAATSFSTQITSNVTYYAIYTSSSCSQGQGQGQGQNQFVPTSSTQTFDPNGGNGSPVVVTGINITIPGSPGHATSGCSFLGWAISRTASTPNSPPVGFSISFASNYTFYAVWSSASCRTNSPSVSTADARPTPQLDLSGLSVIPAPAVGATAGAAGIDLKGKNLPTVASVTVAGKDGKVVTSTETALKLELPTLAPGSYDIVMKTEGNGSITIQNGLVIAAPAPKVDLTPIAPVVITPSVPRTTLVAATTPVPGFVPGKAGVSTAQKAIIQDVVLTKNVTSLECVGVTNAKVSAKLASARAAAICAAAKAQNPELTTSVKTVAEAKVNGPIGSVLINYNR